MAGWLCRSCPYGLEKAEKIIDEMLTYHPDVVPNGIDYDDVIAKIRQLRESAIAALKDQGRWP